VAINAKDIAAVNRAASSISGNGGIIIAKDKGGDEDTINPMDEINPQMSP
jgi:hypothetical protein